MAKTPRIQNQPDKFLFSIPSSTTVQFGSGSYVTIGSIQYSITSNLTATLPALSPLQLYMVYAVVSSSVVSLVITSNVNSAGPSGYTQWKLIGCFLNGQDSVTRTIYAIDQLPSASVAIFSAAQVSIGLSVNGYLPIGAYNDETSVLQQANGSYSSATGTYSVTQPGVLCPFPSARVRARNTVEWVLPASVTNTWASLIFVNNTVVSQASIDGIIWAGSDRSTQAATAYAGTVSKGNLISMGANNNLGTYTASIMTATVDFTGTQAPKDM